MRFRRPENKRTTHAVANDADFRFRRGRVLVDETQHGVRVGENRLPIQRLHMLKHHPPGCIARIDLEVPRAAVIQIRQDHVVARRTQPPRHIVQLFAFAGGIHIEHHSGMGTTFLGMRDEGVHRAVGGLNVDVSINHELPRSGANAPQVGEKASPQGEDEDDSEGERAEVPRTQACRAHDGQKRWTTTTVPGSN